MAAQPIQSPGHSRTLRITWILISILVMLPVISLWIVPWLRNKNFEIPLMTDPGTAEWIVLFVLGSIGCVLLVIGQILAFQNRKVPVVPRIWAAVAVACTLLLWAYWFYATTTRSVVASQAPHPVQLNWKASTTPGVKYRIYRSDTPNNFPSTSLIADGITDTSYLDKTAEPHHKYYYAARAVDASNNESVNSNIADAVVP